VDTGRTPLPTRRLDPSLAAQFEEEGYVVLRGYFANRDAFNAVIEGVVRANLRNPIFMRYEQALALEDIGYGYEDFARKSSSLRIPGIHALSAELRRLVDACGFEDALAQLLPDGARVDLLQSLYFPFSSSQASHSDKFLVSPPAAPYRRETLCGVWMALDGSSRENGALFGWSGSQKVPGKPLPSTYRQHGDYSRDLAVMMINHGLLPHFVNVEAGDAIVWASDFVHGDAHPLVPDRMRRALVLHYGATGEG
jgi:Phytanoyl-CoA dioxygenase (PhyH)